MIPKDVAHQSLHCESSLSKTLNPWKVCRHECNNKHVRNDKLPTKQAGPGPLLVVDLKSVIHVSPNREIADHLHCQQVVDMNDSGDNLRGYCIYEVKQLSLFPMCLLVFLSHRTFAAHLKDPSSLFDSQEDVRS